jgi:ribosomal protein S18 acetylase RimI-like enzyme
VIRYEAFAKRHLDAVVRLCSAAGWTSYEDRATTLRALTAPGCVAVVAVERAVVGFVQLQSDGVVHAHLSNVLVAASHRRRGVGRRLVEVAFARSGARYIDLASTEGAHEFYRSFEHRELPGFRIYPRARSRRK